MNTVGLWASAFVLGGLILTQAGRNQNAQADSVASSNGFPCPLLLVEINLARIPTTYFG